MSKNKNQIEVVFLPHGVLWWLIIGWWWRPIRWFLWVCFVQIFGIKVIIKRPSKK